MRPEDERRRRTGAAGFSAGEVATRCFGVWWRIGRDMAKGSEWMAGTEGRDGAERMEGRKRARRESEKWSNADDSTLLEKRKQEKSRTVESKVEKAVSVIGRAGRRADASKFPA